MANCFSRSFLPIAMSMALCIVYATSAVAQSSQSTSPAENEFGHMVSIYEGYVGQREDQKANMLELTLGRLERTKKMHKDSGVKNAAFERDMADFEASLYAVRHMYRARDASRAGKEGDVVKEMTTACQYAKETAYLDPRLQETCSRFRKFGYKRMT